MSKLNDHLTSSFVIQSKRVEELTKELEKERGKSNTQTQSSSSSSDAQASGGEIDNRQHNSQEDHGNQQDHDSQEDHNNKMIQNWLLFA